MCILGQKIPYGGLSIPMAQVNIKTLNSDVLWPLLYSVGLVLSDNHLFWSITHGLAKQHFGNFKKVENWAYEWSSSFWFKNALWSWYFQDIHLLPKRWEKCVAIARPGVSNKIFFYFLLKFFMFLWWKKRQIDHCEYFVKIVHFEVNLQYGPLWISCKNRQNGTLSSEFWKWTTFNIPSKMMHF